MRYVGEQRPECDHELDAQLLREAGDEAGEGPPAEIRLDAQQEHGIALETRNRRVVEGVVRPVDPPRVSLDQGDVRAGGLEVEESLLLDLGEARRLQGLGQISTCE